MIDKNNIDLKILIIEKSLEMLHTDGLNFSVDALSTRLKISKKTIYKLFACKENLAIAMLNKTFNDINFNADKILQSKKVSITEICNMLLLLEKALYFSDDTIFNRYSLNDKIRVFVQKQLIIIWEKFENLIYNSNFSKILDNSCFKYMVIASLSVFSHKKNDVSLTIAFSELLFGEKL